jgi:hypothetical protein
MILFADDHVMVANTEDELQKAACELNNIAVRYSLNISIRQRRWL